MEESYPKHVENTLGKREIALCEQFLLFLQCFQKACSQGASKGVIVWEWVNAFLNFLFPQKSVIIMDILGLEITSNI